MGRMTILTYHSIDSSDSVVSLDMQVFESHMACLSEQGHRGLSLRDAVQQYVSTGSWPARAAVITFDDGFANVHELALPVIRRYGFSATVFPVLKHVGGCNDWELPPIGLGPRPLLDWHQLEDLVKAGWEIGAHTRSHPDLRCLSGVQLQDEIGASRADLQARLGQTITSFAYPYGLYDSHAESIVAREFQAACTTQLGRVARQPLRRLPRVDAFYLKDPRTFRRLISGRLDNYLTLRRWGRLLRPLILGGSVSASRPHAGTDTLTANSHDS